MATAKKENALLKFQPVKVLTGRQIARAGGLKAWAKKNNYRNTGANTGIPVEISDKEFMEITKQLRASK